MKQLGVMAGGIEIVELYDRIDALALDVDFMRRKRASQAGEHFHPEWSKNIPWTLSA